MHRKKYQEQIAKWLALRDSGKSIRTAFNELGGPSHIDWLILPGDEKAADIPEDAAAQWNEFLFWVFANTPRYRQDDQILWQRLETLASLFQ